MKLKEVLNDLQIETLFERTDESLTPEKFFDTMDLKFKLSDEDEVKRQILNILNNSKKSVKDVMINSGLSIDNGYCKLFKEVFDEYIKQFYSNVRDALTFNILIPNITYDMLESGKIIEYLEKNIFYAIKANPSLNCSYRTCIIRFNPNNKAYDIHFIHYNDPNQDRRYTLQENFIDKSYLDEYQSATIGIHMSLLEYGNNKIEIRRVRNDVIEKMDKQDFLLSKISDEQLKFWNILFDCNFKHIMHFEHRENDECIASGTILHNIHL